MARIEDYAIVGDLHTAALIGVDGSMDWLCLPHFNSAACFAALLDSPEAGRWLLAPASGGSCTTRRYRPGTLILETEWESADGRVRVTDFMPPRDEVVDIVRIVEGLSGAVRMRGELALRFDYGQVVPWVRRDKRGGRAGRGLPGHTGPGAGREPAHRQRLHGACGGAGALRADLDAQPSAPSQVGEPREGLAGHRGVLDKVVRKEPGCGSLQGCCPTLPDHPEGPDLRAHWRHRGRCDDLPARADRWATELGLPVLLASGCDADPAVPALGRVYGGGRGLEGMAAARRRRGPGGAADHVWHLRATAVARDRADLAGRL